MGTADWKRAGIWSAIGIVAAMAIAVVLGPHIEVGTSALMQAFAAIVALGLAIYVPYRQYEDRREEKRIEAAERADAIVKLLKSDILSLTLQCAVALRVVENCDIRSPLMASRVTFMHGMQLRMSGQFDLLSSEVVRADVERLTPLIDLSSAVNYHNGLMMKHGDHPEMIPSENWRQVVAIAEENLRLVWSAAQEAWKAYMDLPMPKLEEIGDTKERELVH